jgi:hypothetical protein
MVVVSDLEFVGLKRHPAYVHRPAVVREAEQVSPELAGTLQRENGNFIVSSESAAKARAERYAKIHAQSKALLDAREANNPRSESTQKQLSPDLDGSLHREDANIVVVSESKAERQNRRPAEARERLELRHKTRQSGTANSDTAAPVARELDSAPPAPEPKLTVPESAPRFSVGWWRGFVFGIETDSFPKVEAIECVRAVLAELGIGIDEKAINFASDPVTGAELEKTLSRLTRGELGWKTLTKLYQQEFSRGRTRQECS